MGFEFSAGLKMKAPHLSTEFTIGYDGDGFCEGQEAKTGISAEPSVKAGLDFVVSKQKPGDKNATVLYEKPDIFVSSLPSYIRICLNRDCTVLTGEFEVV